MIVKYKLDPAHPPDLTDEERMRLDGMTDGDIDYSDVPDQGDAGWTRIVSAPDLTHLRKVALSVEPGVLEFFKAADGGGVDQQRVNQVLSEYVAAQRKAS